MFKYYCFSRPHMSFIAERDYFCFHKPFFPTLSVFVLFGVEVASFVYVRSRSSNCFAMLSRRKVVHPCYCYSIGNCSSLLIQLVDVLCWSLNL